VVLLADLPPDLEVRVEALLQLPSQRLLIALTGLHLPTGELPLQRQHRGFAALRDQIAAVAFHHRSDDTNGLLHHSS
jgi:hypothetical protein